MHEKIAETTHSQAVLGLLSLSPEIQHMLAGQKGQNVFQKHRLALLPPPQPKLLFTVPWKKDSNKKHYSPNHTLRHSSL